MIEKRKDFIKELNRLCNIYSDYISEHRDSRLDVVIGNNMIKMNLYKNEDIIDKFGLLFLHKEMREYNYISIVIMKMLFGNKIVYSRDNMFFNHKGNLLIEVNDMDLYDRMFGIVPIYRDIDFYEKIDNGRRVRNKINRNRNGSNLFERVELTKKLLKRKM